MRTTYYKKNLFLSVLLFVFLQTVPSISLICYGQSQHDLKFSKTTLKWEVGYHKDKSQKPEKWYPATVPGAVQLDLLGTLENPDWQFADGYKQFMWMEDVFFTYRTNFLKPSLSENHQLFFISKGIDYHFEIYLNGVRLLEQ